MSLQDTGLSSPESLKQSSGSNELPNHSGASVDASCLMRVQTLSEIVHQWVQGSPCPDGKYYTRDRHKFMVQSRGMCLTSTGTE